MGKADDFPGRPVDLYNMEVGDQSKKNIFKTNLGLVSSIGVISCHRSVISCVIDVCYLVRHRCLLSHVSSICVTSCVIDVCYLACHRCLSHVSSVRYLLCRKCELSLICRQFNVYYALALDVCFLVFVRLYSHMVVKMPMSRSSV